MQTNRKSSSLLVACVLGASGFFSSDLYSPALPTIMSALHTSQSLTRAIAISFFLGLACSQIFYGILADRFGRKPVIIISLTIVTAGNLLSALATHCDSLIFFRFIAGIGVGSCSVIGKAIIRDHYSARHELIHAFSLFTMASQVSPAIAPLIGGFTIQLFNWQACFLLLTFINIVTAIFTTFWFEDHFHLSSQFDLKNVLEQYRTLLQNKKFMFHSIASGIIFNAFLSFCFISPFLFQNYYHLSPPRIGLVFVLIPIFFTLGSLSNRTLAIFNISQQSALFTSFLLFVLIPLIFFIWSFFSMPCVSLLLLGLLTAYLSGLTAPIMTSLSLMEVTHLFGTGSALQTTIKLLASTAMLAGFLIIDVHSTIDLALMMIFSGLMIIGLHAVFFGIEKTFTREAMTSSEST